MQYISPLHFLPLTDTEAFDRKDIILARKKMLAELELNDDNGIEINGKEVVKNDIVRFFDELQQSAELPWHVAIYQDKVLLHFLEHNILEKTGHFAPNPLYSDEAFIKWISPCYAESFMTFADECLQHLMDDCWSNLMGSPMLMKSHDQERAWNNIEKSIRVNIGHLEFLKENVVTKNTLEGLENSCGFRYVQMLGQLPVERFGQVRNELTVAIMQLCIRVFNEADRNWPLIIIENALILAASEQMKEQVRNKQTEMETIAGNPKNRLSNRQALWLILRVALFVIFIASRISDGCNHSNPAEGFQNAPVYIIRPGIDTQQLMPDGSMKKIKPIPNLPKDTVKRQPSF